MRTLTLFAFVVSLAACSVSTPEAPAEEASGEPAAEAAESEPEGAGDD